MKNQYKLVVANADEKWDNFVQNSQNGTIFSSSFYLNASEVKYKLFYCFKKEELRAAVAVIENDSGKSLILDDLVIYNGIMYNKPTNKQNLAQQFSEQYKIQEFISNELIKYYNNIEMSLHPSIIDIRAILWVNFNTNLPKYQPNIRYTSYIDISDFNKKKELENISIYNNASVSRRQQIRYAIKKSYKTKIIYDVNLLVEFYKKTINRQNLDVEVAKLEKIKKLSFTLVQNKMAKIYASYDEFQELGSIALFSWDNKRAYYIFGANEPSKRDSHCGTNVLWDAFYDLNKMGINEVDLEGINSPNRGWFKLSFGGNIVPYYELIYKRSL